MSPDQKTGKTNPKDLTRIKETYPGLDAEKPVTEGPGAEFSFPPNELIEEIPTEDEYGRPIAPAPAIGADAGEPAPDFGVPGTDGDPGAPAPDLQFDAAEGSDVASGATSMSSSTSTTSRGATATHTTKGTNPSTHETTHELHSPQTRTLQQFADELPVSRTPVAAEFPFTLRINGRLEARDREKLVDLLNRENFGFREVDLEPQFEAGRILIPRISEFAGILIIQTLRDAKVQMELKPSDTSPTATDTVPDVSEVLSSDSAPAGSEHPAEQMPLTTAASTPDLPQFTVLDTITASGAISAKIVHAEQSREHQELLDALKRELKYKAYRKGATALINFSVQFVPLTPPTHYRVLLTATAVKA